MNGPIQAIPTDYAGCRFRSRTEARWAIFLDHLSIPWDYEVQGFRTPAGGYLPDFYLPDMDLFVEIKGPRPNEVDLAKCQHIPNLIILVGNIPRDIRQIGFWSWGPCPKGWPHFLHRCEDGWSVLSAEDHWPFSPYRPPGMDVADALKAARGARFEHGESGPSRSRR